MTRRYQPVHDRQRIADVGAPGGQRVVPNAAFEVPGDTGLHRRRLDDRGVRGATARAVQVGLPGQTFHVRQTRRPAVAARDGGVTAALPPVAVSNQEAWPRPRGCGPGGWTGNARSGSRTDQQPSHRAFRTARTSCITLHEQP